MASTLMPFLYQTRTLANIPFRRMPNAILHSRRTFRMLQKLNAAPSRNNITSTKTPNIPVADPQNPFERTIEPAEGDENNRVVIRKVAIDNKVLYDAKKAKTPTIRESSIPFDNADDDINDTDFASASDPFFTERDIFDDEGQQPSNDLMDTTRQRLKRKSTITVQERDTFKKIFADIMARSKSKKEPLEIDKGDFDQLESISRPASARSKKVAKKSLHALMDEAADYTESTRRQTNNEQGFKTVEDLLKDVAQYPQPLRAAAANALGLVSKKNFEQDTDVDVDNMESLRQPELERVEALMQSAISDVELWQVLEREVFSLPVKLGLVNEPPKPAPAKKTRKKKNAAIKTVPKSDDSAISAPTTDTPNLSILGPLYPSHLLLGLRLLDRSFSKPSPLVLNVLPRIKSLGLISHALGASTPLYNELLRIYWKRYDNFSGVKNLLSEMELIGLEYDEETLSIVRHIDSWQSAVMSNEKGPTVKALLSMPEFALGEFSGWVEKIEAFLDQEGDAEM